MLRCPPDLEPLHAVAVASFDGHGTLLWANAGFRWLIEPAERGEPGTNVARFFLNPSIATLASADAGEGGEVFRGLLTLGDYYGRTHSLRGAVTREGQQLCLLAEHVIEDITRLNDVVLTLNKDYAGAQRDLAQANLILQRLNATLTEQKAALESTLARVSRLEGILSICMYCKNVRTEDDAWQKIEHYVSDHSDAVFSHGLCPTCFQKQMRQLDSDHGGQP